MFLKFAGSLITRSDGKSLSVGRSFLFITFTIMICYWLVPFYGKSIPVPESLNSVFEALLIYEVIKKGRDVVGKLPALKDKNGGTENAG